MRKMTPTEMQEMIGLCNWATICTVTPGGAPYAIEATPFDMDGDVGFMINPRGTTYKNLLVNTGTLLKYTYAEPDLSVWAGVSCHGQGRFVTDPDLIRRGWKLLGDVMGADMSDAADRFCAKPERSPMLLVRILEITGRCNARVGIPMVFPSRMAMAE